jgi:Fibronectin type III domain
MNNTRTSVKHSLFQIFVLFVISSTVFAGGIQLAWDPPPDPVLGYKLYYGTSSGNYTKNMDVGKVATYTLTGLQDGQTYYIAVTAYNDSGESNYSNEVFGVPEPDDTTPPAHVSSFQATSGDSCVTLS